MTVGSCCQMDVLSRHTLSQSSSHTVHCSDNTWSAVVPLVIPFRWQDTKRVDFVCRARLDDVYEAVLTCQADTEVGLAMTAALSWSSTVGGMQSPASDSRRHSHWTCLSNRNTAGCSGDTLNTCNTHRQAVHIYRLILLVNMCNMSRIDQPAGLWWHDGGCDTNIIDKWKRSNRNHLTWLWMHKVIEWVGWSIGKYHLIQLNNVVWWLKHKTSLGPNYVHMLLALFQSHLLLASLQKIATFQKHKNK